MRKAAKTGLLAGIILSVTITLLVTITRAMEITHLAAIILILLLMIVGLWVAMKQYDSHTSLKWKNLALTGTVASITTALLVSTASFVFTRYIQPGYLSELVGKVRAFWRENSDTPVSFAGNSNDWAAWLRTPLDFALNNFRLLAVFLMVMSLIIASVYYFRNKDKNSFHNRYKNPELIF